MNVVVVSSGEAQRNSAGEMSGVVDPGSGEVGWGERFAIPELNAANKALMEEVRRGGAYDDNGDRCSFRTR